MKRLLVVALFLSACATTTPKLDIERSLNRGNQAMDVALGNLDWEAINTSLERFRKDYYDIIGKSPAIDAYVEVRRNHGWAYYQMLKAEKESLSIEPYYGPFRLANAQITELIPRLSYEIDLAQRTADAERARSMAIMQGMMAGAALSNALAPPVYTTPAPALVPTQRLQTNCTVLPAGRNTVTGQSYGSYVYCR